MGKRRSGGKEFNSRQFETITSLSILEERQRRDLDRRLKVAHQKAEARKQKELQIKKKKEAIALELKKRRQNIAFEKSIKNASPVKSYAVFDKKRQREEINFQTESLMTGEHFASRLGKALQGEVNNAKGHQKDVLIRQLKNRANEKEGGSPSSETFDDIGRRNFNKLISLIAKKAYLDLGIETDGKAYTKLESQISALSNKIAKKGLPINLTFTFGSIRIRTSNPKEKGFQANPLFDWKLPKWVKLGGVSAATVATVIACGGKAPPAEHEPAAPIEEDAAEQAPAAPVEEAEEQAPDNLTKEPKAIATEPPAMIFVELPTGVATLDTPPTVEAVEEAYSAPTNWKDWDFENYTETERMTAENMQDGLKNMEANYISKLWRDGSLKNTETGEDAKDWEEADLIFKQNYSFVYQDNTGYKDSNGQDVPYSWMMAIIDKNGKIIHAENAIDGSQLPLLTAFSIEDIDDFSFSEEEMPEGGVKQIIVPSKDGQSFTKVTLDAEGNAIGWTDLVTGKTVDVIQIKEFKFLPEISNFGTYFIPPEELDNGNYRRWAETLVGVEDFKLSKVKTPNIKVTGMLIIDDYETGPDFDDPDTAYFKHRVTFGYTEYTNELGEKLKYIVMPIFYLYEGEVHVVITLYPLHRTGIDFTKEVIDGLIDIWKYKMNMTAIAPNEKVPFTNEIDPFVAKTFDNEALDMSQRLDDFERGDLSALSGSDEEGEIILLNVIIDDDDVR